MRKLIIQIPCYNEAATLPATLADIPRRVDGVDQVEILVIDDGSTDGTTEAARLAGADHIVRNKKNIGLAQSFQVGLDAAIARGASIIVNTDGDNQYAGADIPKLIAPIVAGDADIVVGDRQTGSIAHFSPLKKTLQAWGSAVVGRLSGVDTPDAVSGFRAFSRDAAMSLTVRSTFSYTTETLIQAGKKRLVVKTVPVRTNGETRPSRLFRSIPQFLMNSARTMLRAYAMYEPLKIFLVLGLALMVIGAAPMVRFLFHYLAGDGQGMVQSLIIGAAFVLLGGMAIMFAMVADLVAYNRHLLELTLERVRRIEASAMLSCDDLGGQPSRRSIAESAIRREIEDLPHVRKAGGAGSTV
ncbi:MAG: glycosyltransferase [Alphaproteobacteria bacterium]|nr:glycosyltransferase [Alphaproteobacteria bacterium]